VAIHCTIVQKHCCYPWCLPTLTTTMLTAIYKPSTVQKHPAKCTSPPGSSDALAFPQTTRNQWGVHSALVSRWVNFRWWVSILTTAWSSIALPSESPGTLHPVELFHLLSR
jgi:hypothetical protein